MPLFDVSVTRVAYHDHVIRVEAADAAEAEKKGRGIAADEDANNWIKSWGEVQVEEVHPLDATGNPLKFGETVNA